MNAEEYKQIEIAFIAKYAHHWITTEFQEDLKEVSIAYHQAKSKEEAVKRYENAQKVLPELHGDVDSINGLILALQIAAGLGEMK